MSSKWQVKETIRRRRDSICLYKRNLVNVNKNLSSSSILLSAVVEQGHVIWVAWSGCAEIWNSTVNFLIKGQGKTYVLIRCI